MSLEPLYAFAYYGRHGEAFSHRKEWFVKPDYPNYTAWWVVDDHLPGWEEAYAMQKLLVSGTSPVSSTTATAS